MMKLDYISFVQAQVRIKQKWIGQKKKKWKEMLEIKWLILTKSLKITKEINYLRLGLIMLSKLLNNLTNKEKFLLKKRSNLQIKLAFLTKFNFSQQQFQALVTIIQEYLLFLSSKVRAKTENSISKMQKKP